MTSQRFAGSLFFLLTEIEVSPPRQLVRCIGAWPIPVAFLLSFFPFFFSFGRCAFLQLKCMGKEGKTRQGTWLPFAQVPPGRIAAAGQVWLSREGSPCGRDWIWMDADIQALWVLLHTLPFRPAMTPTAFVPAAELFFKFHAQSIETALDFSLLSPPFPICDFHVSKCRHSSGSQIWAN